MKLIKIKGLYSDIGKIELENMKTISLGELTDEKTLQIPFGSAVELSVEYDENDFLSGKDGIVWASYDTRQIDVIKNALFAQNINADIKLKNLGRRKIFLLMINNNNNDQIEAIDFIWKSNNGLRLKPDWSYPDGEINKSFELWLSGQ